MLLAGQLTHSFFVPWYSIMIAALIALKNQLNTRETFMNSGSQGGMNGMIVIGAIVLFAILYSYGAARLSYFYNVNSGNAGYAMMWSILVFFFSDLYYPFYSFFLNPQSARNGNNIKLIST